MSDEEHELVRLVVGVVAVGVHSAGYWRVEAA